MQAQSTIYVVQRTCHTRLGQPSGLSCTAVYSLGFFLFWAFAAASSAFTCFLQRGSAEVNRLCPLAPAQRPRGCPRSLTDEGPTNS